MERNVLSLLVANHFGVLTRVTNLFGQRGFNIDSLAVGETENPRFSRITITTHGDDRVINQIKLQLAKLEDVKAVVEIPEEQLRELRGRCIQEVKKTHGMISLDDAVEYQNGGD